MVLAKDTPVRPSERKQKQTARRDGEKAEGKRGCEDGPQKNGSVVAAADVIGATAPIAIELLVNSRMPPA